MRISFHRKYILILCFLMLSIGLFGISKTFAASSTPISGGVSVKAHLGDYFLSISGIIAPNASVTLLIGGVPVSSTTADSTGKFTFSQIAITKGLTQFCFDGIDFKRYGESYSCITIPPAQANVTQDNIFLPPTIGLERSSITQGEEGVIRGYSMPNATVTITVGGKTYTATTDATGYYEVHITEFAPGQYELFADATYHNQNSLKPQKGVTLIVFSLVKEVGQVLTGTPWFIALFLLLLLLILLLLRKLHPEWFTWIDEGKDAVFSHVPFLQRKLHHAWFMGY